MIIPNNLPVPIKREFWQIQDSTKLQCYDRCARCYFYEYILGWRSDATSNHLVFGQAWHEALAHLYQNKLQLEAIPAAYDIFMQCYRDTLPETTDGWFKGKNPGIIVHAFIEYCQKYASDAYEYKVLATEIGGLVPISDNRMIALRMDLIAQDNKGIIFAMEHKTGSQAGRTWTMQWDTSIQIGTYLHALASSYCDSTNDAKICINGTFFYMKERKFERVWERRAGWAMLNWLYTVNSIYDSIEADLERLSRCKDSDSYLKCFRMSPKACTDYGGCSYFNLCTAVSNPLHYVNGGPPPTGFVYDWWNPLEEVKTPLEIKSA